MRLMTEVKVNREYLLKTLKENLRNHKSEINSLLLDRRTEVSYYLVSVIDRISESDEYQPKENIRFPLPKDNSKYYENAIRMVEMSVDENITLNEVQFDQLVMDNWHWKQDLLATSALYRKF